MNYEKKYKEALERAKLSRLQLLDIGEEATEIEYIFPELKESEDERIGREIIEFIMNFRNGNYEKPYDYTIGTWVGWLEKQNGSIKIKKDKNYLCTKTHKYAGVEWIKDTKYYASDNYTLVNQECEYYCPEYSKEEHNNLFEEVKYDGWLEKQGEQKLVDKVEPKFKVGDWIISKYMHLVMQILNNNGFYKTVETDGTERNDSYDYIERNFKLWIIEDAKDGDVLYSLDSKRPFIYKDRLQFSQARGYCCINKFGEFAVWYTSKCVICTDKYIPATKEQCELLFSKMKDAGYEWDAEKKELKRIEKQALKPKWCEEDEKNWLGIIDEIKANKSTAPDYDIETYDRFLSWLDNIKQRIEK